MKVQDVMTRSVVTCSKDDSLQTAAQKLWERDCGCLPVVDGDHRAIAMITDRDVCMAAFTTGRPLHELQVQHAMSKQLVSCREHEDLPSAGARMAKHSVRRLPVLDGSGKLVGVLSINDLAVNAAKEPPVRGSGVSGEALRVLCGVSSHRADDEATKPSGQTPSSSANSIIPAIPPAAAGTPAQAQAHPNAPAARS